MQPRQTLPLTLSLLRRERGTFGGTVSRSPNRDPRRVRPPLPARYVFSVAAGILPAVEPGILPGGMGLWLEKSLPLRTSGPGGKMPPSTAAKMAATTDVNPTLNTYRPIRGRGGRLGWEPLSPALSPLVARGEGRSGRRGADRCQPWRLRSPC